MSIRNRLKQNKIMTVREIAEKLNLRVFSGEAGLDREVTGGYVSDLLSDVMGFAKDGSVWVTLQTHKNVMAIATLKELAAVIIVKGFEPEEDAREVSEEEGIPILGSGEQTFELAGRIYNLLSRG